jgi:hypothetical protein
MPRTPISDDLVHAPDAAHVDERLAALVAAIEPAARAWAHGSLAAEAAALGAGEWIAQARSALGALLRDPSSLARVDDHALTASLQRDLAREVPAPDEHDVGEHALATAQAMATAWCEVLATGVARAGAVALDDAMLPCTDAGDTVRIVEALDPFGVGEDALRTMFRAASHALFASGAREMELPLELVLSRDAHGALSVRGASPAVSAIAHSGERRRDGADEVPAVHDRAKRRG